MSQPIEFGDVLPKTLFDEIGKELFKKGWRLSNKSAKGTRRFWTQHQSDNKIFNKAGEIVKEKIKEVTNKNIKLQFQTMSFLFLFLTVIWHCIQPTSG